MTSIIDDVSFHRSDFYWVWFSPDLHLSYAFLKAFVDLLLLTVSGNSFQARAARNRKDWLRISVLARSRSRPVLDSSSPHGPIDVVERVPCR